MQKDRKARVLTSAIAVFLIVLIVGVSWIRNKTVRDDVTADAQPAGPYFAMSGEWPKTAGIDARNLYEQEFVCLEDGDEYEQFYIRDGILYHDEYAETGEYDEGGLAIYEWRKNQIIAENVIYVDYNDYGYGNNAVYITDDHVLHGTGLYEGIFLENVKFARVYADAMMALTLDGTLWCKGRIHSLTDDTELVYKGWEPVMTDVAYASLGHLVYFAIKEDGSLYMWGDNSHGQFGDGCLLSPIYTAADGEPVLKMDTYFYREPVKVADGIKMAWYGVPGEQYCAQVSMNEPYSSRMWFVTESDEMFVCGENINDEIRTFYYFGELGPVPEGIEINATSRLYPVISRKGEHLTR